MLNEFGFEHVLLRNLWPILTRDTQRQLERQSWSTGKLVVRNAGIPSWTPEFRLEKLVRTSLWKKRKRVDGNMRNSSVEGVGWDRGASERKRANGFWEIIRNVFPGRAGSKEEGMVNWVKSSKGSRRMRPEKRPLDLKVMKFYRAFAWEVSMK